MVAGSRDAPGGVGNYMAALVAALAIAGCSGGGSQPAASSARANASPHVSLPSPTTAPATTYWVLATLGLKLHQQPDLGSPAVTVLRPGAQLDATEHRNGWIHVHADSQPDLDGWVVDDPLLVTTTPVQQDGSPALNFRVLIPQAWTPISEPDATHLAGWQDPSGKPQLSVQEAATKDQLAKPPPGHAVRQEGPVDVFGKTVLITVYAVDAGGFQYELVFEWAAGRDYRITGTNSKDDDALFKQLLASVVIT